MKTKTKPARLTRAQLERKLLEAEAMSAHVYHFASGDISKTENLLGSGVILQLSYLGGKEVFRPVCIRDGLSPETVLAIQRDLKRSYDLAVMFKPKEV